MKHYALLTIPSFSLLIIWDIIAGLYTVTCIGNLIIKVALMCVDIFISLLILPPTKAGEIISFKVRRINVIIYPIEFCSFLPVATLTVLFKNMQPLGPCL